MTPMRYVFEDCELDVDAFELRRSGTTVPMQPKVFDVLRYLVEQQGRIVTKQELFDNLWPDEHVSESALAFSISHVRKALGQDRGAKLPLQTVHGRGYRFMPDVRVVDGAESALPSAGALPLGSIPPAGAIPVATPDDTFVGRDDVMAALLGAFERARAGRGSLIALIGEGGIGKTRCAEELVERALPLGAVVATGRSYEGQGAPALWLFVQLLRKLASEPRLASEAEALRELVAELGPSADTPETDPDAGELAASTNAFWLLDRLASLLRLSCRTWPLLLIIDDLQWSDAASLNLLHLLQPELSSLGVLVVATARDDLPSGGFQARMLGRALRGAQRIELQPLDQAEVESYVAATTGEPGLHRLSAALHERTAGNPLFLQETLRLLLDRHADGLTAVSPGAIELPEVMRDLIEARLASVDESTRGLLASASVLGERFELSMLARILDRPAEELLGALEPALDARLLTRPQVGHYAFAHSPLRSTLHGGLRESERAALHARAADTLEAMAMPSRLNELTHHLREGQPVVTPDRLRRHATRAAMAALRVAAFADAGRYFRWALEATTAMPEPDPRSVAELQLAAGGAMMGAGRRRQGSELIAAAIEQGIQHGYADVLVRAANVRRPTFLWSILPDAAGRRALETVRDLLPDDPKALSPRDRAMRAAALSRLAATPPYSLAENRWRPLLDEAMALSRDPDDPDVQRQVLQAKLALMTAPDDVDDLLAAADELLELDRAGPETWVSGDALQARYLALSQRGDMVGAERALDAFGRLAHRFRLPEVIWNYDRYRLQERQRRGDLDTAEAARELYDRAVRLELFYARLFNVLQPATLLYEREGAAALVAHDELWQPVLAMAPINAFHESLVIRALAGAGKLDEARGRFHTAAARDFTNLPKNFDYLRTLCHLAEAAATLGERRRCEQLQALLKPYEDCNTTSGYGVSIGAVVHYLGLLAGALDRDIDANAYLERAIERNEELGQPVFAVRARVAAASQFLERGGGSRRRAAELATEAREQATARGYSELARRAEELERALR